MHDHLFCCLPYYSQIKPYSPILNVPYITLYATFHLPKFLCFASETCYLCPSCDAGLYEMAYHVCVYKLSVYLCVMKHVGAGAYYAHITDKHIEKLRQLVDVGFTHEISESKLSWIIFSSLDKIRVFVDMHGAELVTIEVMAV